jgi:hypothetical protein
VPIPSSPYARYRASELVLSDGDPVATWADEGSGGNNLTQGTAGLRPVFKASEAINGNPSVLFAQDGLATATYGAALSQPVTIVIIFQMATTASNAWLHDGLSTGRLAQFREPGTTTQWRFFGGSTVNMGGGPSANTVYLHTAYYNGSSSSLQIDGSTTSGSVNVGSQTLTGFVLGNRFSFDSSPTSVYIAEVLIYNRQLTGSDPADLLDYYETTYINQAVAPDATTVTVTPGSVTVDLVGGPPQDITPAAVTVTATPGTLTIATGAVDVTPAPVTITATAGTLTVAAGAVNIVPAAVTVTATPGTLFVSDGAERNITVTAALAESPWAAAVGPSRWSATLT